MSDNINPTATEGGLTIPEDTGDTSTPTEGGKTFTQQDVDRIVGERLARTKAEFAAKEQQRVREHFELQARGILKLRRMPETLLTALNVTDIGELEKVLDTIEVHMRAPRLYIPDGNGGQRLAQPHEVNMPPARPVTPEQMARLSGQMDTLRSAFGLQDD